MPEAVLSALTHHIKCLCVDCLEGNPARHDDSQTPLFLGGMKWRILHLRRIFASHEQLRDPFHWCENNQPGNRKAGGLLRTGIYENRA
jgi:hypothetical protein